MPPLSRDPSALATVTLWLVNLAMRLLARSLQIPEPFLRSTGIYVFAQAQAAEDSFAKSLCPVRLFRRLLALSRD